MSIVSLNPLSPSHVVPARRKRMHARAAAAHPATRRACFTGTSPAPPPARNRVISRGEHCKRERGGGGRPPRSRILRATNPRARGARARGQKIGGHTSAGARDSRGLPPSGRRRGPPEGTRRDAGLAPRTRRDNASSRRGRGRTARGSHARHAASTPRPPEQVTRECNCGADAAPSPRRARGEGRPGGARRRRSAQCGRARTCGAWRSPPSARSTLRSRIPMKCGRVMAR